MTPRTTILVALAWSAVVILAAQPWVVDLRHGISAWILSGQPAKS